MEHASKIKRYNNLGVKSAQSGDLKQSAIYFEKVLSYNSNDVAALNNLANILIKSRNFKKASQILGKVLKADPSLSSSYLHLGYIYYEQKQFIKAVPFLNKYLKFVPDNPRALKLLGDCYLKFGEFDKALISFSQSLSNHPYPAKVLNDIGVVFLNQGEIKKAISYFKKAAAIDPQLPNAYFHLGQVYENAGFLNQAASSLKTTLDIDPSFYSANSLLRYVKMQQCDWSNDEYGHLEDTPFLNVIRIQDPKINYQFAKAKSEEIKKSIADSLAPFKFTNRKNKKIIHIGYLSGDFREHVIARLIWQVFELHDRTKFKIYAYSFGRNDNSELRNKIQKGADKFRDLFNLGFADSAKQIYQDEIDILVELTGHTSDCRLEIAALRPSPIQVTYLGFPGTTGADFMDYIITDKNLTPPDQDRFYSEKFIYMPHCYQIGSRPAKTRKKVGRKDYNLPKNCVIFASFNKTGKNDPLMFEAWMEILKSVHNSILWILSNGYKTTENNLRKEALIRGVDPKRLFFAEKVPLEEHLNRLTLVDICLDTRIYNGGATTSYSLWAGIPVISLPGTHYLSRMGSSILIGAGLEELVAKNLEDYKNLAISIANDQKKLADIKKRVKKAIVDGPLFDTPRFVKNLEKAYELIWNNYRSGRKPHNIEANGKYGKN